MSAVVWDYICSPHPVRTIDATPTEVLRVPCVRGTNLFIRSLSIEAQDLAAPQRAWRYALGSTMLDRSRAPAAADVTYPYGGGSPVVTDLLSLGYSVQQSFDTNFWIFTATGAAGQNVDWTSYIEYATTPENIFIPTDLGITADWWRADMGVTLGAGNDITALASQGPAGTSLGGFGLGVTFPQYRASGVNGYPDITLDGNNFFKSGVLAITQPGTFFIVVTPTAVANQYLLDGLTLHRWQALCNVGTGNVDLNAGANISAPGAMVAGATAVWQFDVDGVNGAIYKNNVLVAGPGNVGADTLDGITLMMSKGGAFGLLGSMQEGIRCSAVPNATQRGQYTKYLRSRWGI